MNAHIVLGKQVPPFLDGVIIGVDVSSYYLLQSSYKEIIAIGDFDSCTKEQITFIKNNAKEIIIHPKVKDHTDFELALMYVKEQRFENVYVHYPFFGNRMDHLLGNITLLEKYNNDFNGIQFMDDYNKMYILNPGTYTFLPNEKKYRSFFALDEVDLTLKRFKYELNNYSLKRFNPLCVSNEIVDEGIVHFTQGRLLTIESND